MTEIASPLLKNPLVHNTNHTRKSFLIQKSCYCYRRYSTWHPFLHSNEKQTYLHAALWLDAQYLHCKNCRNCVCMQDIDYLPPKCCWHCEVYLHALHTSTVETVCMLDILYLHSSAVKIVWVVFSCLSLQFSRNCVGMLPSGWMLTMPQCHRNTVFACLGTLCLPMMVKL